MADVLQADVGHGSMTRCIARESPTRIGMSPPGIITRASQRDAPPADRLPQTHGRPGRGAEASTTRDPRRAVPLPQVAPAPRTRAVGPLAPIAGRVRAIAAAIQTLDRAEATRLRTAAGAFQIPVRVRAVIQVLHALAAEDSAAAAGLQAAAVHRDPSEAAEAARARPEEAVHARPEEAAVAVVGGNQSGRRTPPAGVMVMMSRRAEPGADKSSEGVRARAS